MSASATQVAIKINKITGWAKKRKFSIHHIDATIHAKMK